MALGQADRLSAEKLEVARLEDPKFDRDLIDSLVMNKKRVDTLKSLAKSYARIDKNGEEMTQAPWAADFVRGKGNGLIFLLHGKPGVGKTCTAGEHSTSPMRALGASKLT